MTLKHVPNPHTNQIIHEAEIWIKDNKGRRKLDLMVKYSKSRGSTNFSPSHSSSPGGGGNNGGGAWVLDGTNDEMEREYHAYNDVVEDLRKYLRNEKGIADPEHFLCLPMR